MERRSRPEGFFFRLSDVGGGVTGVGLLSKRLSLATDEQQKEKASFVKY
jgi:hypothetical protein